MTASDPDAEPGRRRSDITAAALASIVSVVTIAGLVVAFRSDRTLGSGIQTPRGTGTPPAASSRSFGGWTISVSVTPTRVGSIAFSVEPVIDASAHEGKFGWLEHAFVVRNTGTHALHLTDARTSSFLGPPDRALLVADWGCGFGFDSPGGEVNAGVCDTSLVIHTLQPGDSLSRNISIYKGMPGMSPLEAGTYVFHQPFGYGGADGPGIHELTLDVTYSVAAS